MTSTARTITQVRLPGQAAAPAGPVDLIGMYVVHHAFRRDLSAFAATVPDTPPTARATWQALADRWAGFAHVLHHHHSTEDAALWPLLLERVDAAGDRDGRATLEAMADEHAGIDPALEACARGFAGMASGGTADDRAALAVRTAAARDAVDRHLAHEETDAMPLVQRYLTQAEWDGIERGASGGRMRLSEVAFVVPWICLGLPVDVRERLLAGGGRGFGLVWRLTRGRFARRHRRAFGS